MGGGDEVKVGCEQGKRQGKPSKVLELESEVSEGCSLKGE